MAKASCGLWSLLFLSSVILLFLASAPPATAKVPVPFGSRFAGLDTFIGTPFSNFSKGQGLKKRAPDLTWDAALAKGQTMLSKIAGTRQNTQWTTVPQLEDNGWVIADEKPDTFTDDYNQHGGPYQTLGINQDDGYAISADQSRPFSNCHGEDNQAATSGLFDQVYNPRGKAIISTYSFSPLHFVKRAHPGVPVQQLAPFLPGPHRWSEIVWAIWAGVAPVENVQPGSLKYIFRHEIATANTRHIMELAANVGEDKLDLPWPGVRLAKGSQQYQALMGTPHGTSMAWLLIDHPDDLPGREFESIWMFTTDSEEGYNLLFVLND